MEKADSKYIIEGEDGEEKKAPFTNFEFLKRKVDFLMVVVNKQSEILRQNQISEKTDSPAFTDLEVFSSLTENVEEEPEDVAESTEKPDKDPADDRDK